MSFPKKKCRPVVQFFSIPFAYGPDTYAVIPLDPDPRQARKAFRLRKQTGDHQVDDVRLTERGPQCECKGYRFRGRCKHLKMLQAAWMFD